MRMCGHAHHDDMLYLGKDPQPSWEYPPLTEQGYANRELYEYWAARDPIAMYAARLEAEGRDRSRRRSTRMKREAEAIVEAQARAVIDAPWPDREGRRRRRVRERAAARARRGARSGVARADAIPALPPLEPGRRSIRRAARSSKR
jgi:hypothetical protein